MKRIDLLIINNAPAFYKINLYNELARRCNIHVVFLGLTKKVVISEKFKDEILFSYEILFESQIELRNKFYSFVKLYTISRKFIFKKIIYGGYDTLECFLLPFFISKKKNCLQFESSIKESKVKGSIAIIKKLLFKRFAIALPSGKLQSAVFEALKYNGRIIETYGVGIFNKRENRDNKENSLIRQCRYLYVGRLIDLKNLIFLVDTFNSLNKPLTIVGTGELESQLKLLANKNITFSGFISNEDIYKYYLSHDIFILPSIAEPWGLVVEEAIYFGLPVIVSEAVGCQEELVVMPNTGLTFSPFSQSSLFEAINQIESSYNFYKNNCCRFDFDKRDLRQIEAYLKILSI
jgi:glycosyltransferase involved in cell wall biosynthesis